MQIELIGCTGAGKSSLAGGILLAAEGGAVELSMAYEYVLGQWRLQWLKSRLARTLLLDVASLLACVASWHQHQDYLRFALRIVRSLPIGWFERANLTRNVLKKVGIHEIVRRCSSEKDMVFVDEGTLQSAHYLFVHVSAEAAAEDVERFAKLVPLPDIAVYVTQSERELVERTLRRGHARIRNPSRETVQLFVGRAIATLDRVWQEAVAAGRMSMVERGEGVVIGACRQDEAVRRAQTMIRAGMDAGYRSNAEGPSGFSTPAWPAQVMTILKRRPGRADPPGQL
jgi:hypothetical protein